MEMQALQTGHEWTLQQCSRQSVTETHMHVCGELQILWGRRLRLTNVCRNVCVMKDNNFTGRCVTYHWTCEHDVYAASFA